MVFFVLETLSLEFAVQLDWMVTGALAPAISASPSAGVPGIPHPAFAHVLEFKLRSLPLLNPLNHLASPQMGFIPEL